MGDLCEHHARLAAELGRETVVNGAHAKKRSARQRTPVATESEPLELTSRGSNRPSAVRPALALTAAEEVETIRRVRLEAATSTSRESWASCTCAEQRAIETKTSVLMFTLGLNCELAREHGLWSRDLERRHSELGRLEDDGADEGWLETVAGLIAHVEQALAEAGIEYTPAMSALKDGQADVEPEA